jgi:hypothetical protein
MYQEISGNEKDYFPLFDERQLSEVDEKLEDIAEVYRAMKNDLFMEKSVESLLWNVMRAVVQTSTRVTSSTQIK